MRDAYEALYTAGCDDLAQVDLGARMVAVAALHSGGQAAQTLAVVFKTRLKREAADTIDWAKKEVLEFSEIWETLLLNPRCRKELTESKEGD